MANDLVTVAATFELLADFGEILVRLGYVHQKRLWTFRERYQKDFSLFDNNVTDQHFANVTRQLAGGQRLRIRAFVTRSKAPPGACLSFIEQRNGLLVGAQGLTVAYQELRGKLPNGLVYASFDRLEALWTDGPWHSLPCIRTDNKLGHILTLRVAEAGLLQGQALLLFTEA